MTYKKKHIAVDFDGVLATYDGWKGFDVLGQPQIEAIKAIRKLKEMGYQIIIFTTRIETPTIHEWLKRHDVPFDAVNSNKHNPPFTSIKPIYHCIIDDRAVNYHGQSCEELLGQVAHIMKTDI